MNGTKWYKLNKSNEPLLITLHEELHNLETSMSSEISSALTTVAEIIFSGLLTYFIDRDVDLLSFLWPSIAVNPSQNTVFWGTILSCSVVFLGSIAACKLIIFLIKMLMKTFNNEKKTQTGIFQLERYFYQKVLNDIITGVSLEKKSCELLAEVDNSVSSTQDKNLSSIYLIESVFYFHEALRAIAEKNVFWVSNEKREEYTDFLEAINPHIICDIFQMCELTLARIIETLGGADAKTTEKARDAYDMFLSYRREICIQMKIQFSEPNR